jgi:ferredoxin, 2Fe-2S
MVMNRRAFTVGSLIPGIPLSPFPTLSEHKTSHTPVAATSKVEKQQKKIVLTQNGNRFEIMPVKGNLLDVALTQGNPLQYKCKKGTCGQCTVKVIEGAGLSDPNSQEHKKLTKDIQNGYRLACQAEIV